MDSWLGSELSNAHNDSERVFVYQRAFDCVMTEFHRYRPLLERIKQQYDAMSRMLLARKREMMTDTSSLSVAEDSLSEMVNRSRRARAQEFAQNRAESERLLDEMTALRVQRSDLLRQLEGLQGKHGELERTSGECEQQSAELGRQLLDMLDEIRQAESETGQCRKSLAAIKAKLAKTETSASDLAIKEEALAAELRAIEDEESAARQRISVLGRQADEAQRKVVEMRREIDALIVERDAATARKKEALLLHGRLERNFRKAVGDHQTPLAELLATICGNQPHAVS
jgi:chromosome segregation ATPase